VAEVAEAVGAVEIIVVVVVEEEEGAVNAEVAEGEVGAITTITIPPEVEVEGAWSIPIGSFLDYVVYPNNNNNNTTTVYSTDNWELGNLDHLETRNRISHL